MKILKLNTTIVYVIISIFIFTINVKGQDQTFLLLDDETKEPVPYANICFENIQDGKAKYTISSIDGVFTNPCKEKVKVAISFSGYKTIIDTINTNEVKTYFLKSDIFALEQVVVTGQNKPVLRDSSIYDISVFSSKLIEQRGAVDLGDALKSQPSIKIKQSGVAGSNINILGLGGENVKIMIDGVPIIGRIDGNLDLSQISMSNVDHIEVIEGPMSVVYGSNALAGTVNIITKNNKWNKNLLNVNTYFETPGTINADVFTSIKRGENVTSASLARNYFAGTMVNDTSRESKWKGSTQYTGELRYIYSGSKFTFRSNANYFNELMKDKGTVVGEDSPTPNAIDVHFLTKRYGMSSFLDLNHTKNMSTNIQASVSLYNRSMNTVRKDMTDLSEINLRGDTTSFVSYMARAVFNNKLSSKMEYQTGFDFSSETGEAQRIAGGLQNISDYALFITGKHTFWHILTFQPGLRFAYNTKFKTPLLYSLNTKLDMYDNVKIRASFAKGFRAPTLKEMYLDFSHANYNIHGNRNLLPESSYTLNSTIEYTKRNNNKSLFKIEAKGYYNNIKNKIGFDLVSTDSISGVQTWQNINLGYIETVGAVANADLKLNNTWAFNVNYAYAGVTSLLYLEDNSNNKFIFSSKVLTSAEYILSKYNFSTRIEYVFNGEDPARYIDEDTNLEPTIESYHDLNLTLTKSFLKRKLNITLGAKNLFNNTDLAVIGTSAEGGSEHSSNGSYRMLSLGRTYFLKINIKLSKN